MSSNIGQQRRTNLDVITVCTLGIIWDCWYIMTFVSSLGLLCARRSYNKEFERWHRFPRRSYIKCISLFVLFEGNHGFPFTELMMALSVCAPFFLFRLKMRTQIILRRRRRIME